MYHSYHISAPNVPLQPNAEDYFLLIFRLRQRRLNLQRLFTTTFNLPGAAGKLLLAKGDDSDVTVRLRQPHLIGFAAVLTLRRTLCFPEGRTLE